MSFSSKPEENCMKIHSCCPSAFYDSYFCVRQKSHRKFPESLLSHCGPDTRAEANAGISHLATSSLCLTSCQLVVEPVVRLLSILQMERQR